MCVRCAYGRQRRSKSTLSLILSKTISTILAHLPPIRFINSFARNTGAHIPKMVASAVLRALSRNRRNVTRDNLEAVYMNLRHNYWTCSWYVEHTYMPPTKILFIQWQIAGHELFDELVSFPIMFLVHGTPQCPTFRFHVFHPSNFNFLEACYWTSFFNLKIFQRVQNPWIPTRTGFWGYSFHFA